MISASIYQIFGTLRQFIESNLPAAGNSLLVDLSILLIIVVTAVACFYITELLMLGVEWIVSFTETTWDDDLLNHRLIRTVSQLTPALMVKAMLNGFYPNHHYILHIITTVYIGVVALFIVFIFMDNLYEALFKRPRFKAFAVKGIFQMVKLVIGAFTGLYIVAYLIHIPTWSIIKALGAAAAVLLLIFQNTLLGLVASIQLWGNKMLQIGDWIVSEKHAANGEVIDISLTTIKVKNWDNSITTIPPYALVNDSFRNYQPMRDSGGRRVDRSIIIDVNSVRFLSKDELESLRKRGWLDGLGADSAAQQINLGLLRAYLESWLTAHRRVRADLLLMVRQMEPTQYGLPLQLYFFTDATVWKEYEKVQSDIFDHVFAIIREFGLTIYQTPAADDVRSLAKQTK